MDVRIRLSDETEMISYTSFDIVDGVVTGSHECFYEARILKIHDDDLSKAVNHLTMVKFVIDEDVE